MYHDFYQFKENPFNVTADPDFFFSTKCHTDAISSLMYGIGQRKGILVITGEIGTGKTTVCRKLLKQSHDKTKFALVLNPKFSDVQLLQMIAHDFGIETNQKNKFALTHVLNEFLLAESAKGNNLVLVIDEAQNLTVNQLEQVRLLSNLETEKEKLLQIILLGQPELQEKLKLPSLRQLRQRIAIHYHLQPLTKDDLQKYIEHRIVKAMSNPERSPRVVFTDQAINAIYHYTEGSPRTINILCDRALTAGFVAETFSIDADLIKLCAMEVPYLEHHL